MARFWMIAPVLICLSLPSHSQQNPSAAGDSRTAAEKRDQGAAPAKANNGAKVIRSAEEYNAYIAAMNCPDLEQKGPAMEAFAARYPLSAVIIDALEQAIAAYDQSGNHGKAENVAEKLLQIDPENFRALAICTTFKRNAAIQETDPRASADSAQQAGVFAEKGLAALRDWETPPGLTQAEGDRLRRQMIRIFSGAAGFSALVKKDYAHARDFYQKAVEADRGSLENNLQLAIADLQTTPPNLSGFWYCGHAVFIAHAQNIIEAEKETSTYCTERYRDYTGKPEGWNQIVMETVNQTEPPAGFSERIPVPSSAAMHPVDLPPPLLRIAGLPQSLNLFNHLAGTQTAIGSGVRSVPEPCRTAVALVRLQDPKSLSFRDWESVLEKRYCTRENEEAAEKVWSAIQSLQVTTDGIPKKLTVSVRVISATPENIHAAITTEKQSAGQADLLVAMEKPQSSPPAPGAMIRIAGRITDFQSAPVIFFMEHGEVIAPGFAVNRPAASLERLESSWRHLDCKASGNLSR